MKASAQNRKKLTPSLSTKCPYWLNSPLSMRLHYKFQDFKVFFTPKSADVRIWRTLSPNCGRLYGQPTILHIQDIRSLYLSEADSFCFKQVGPPLVDNQAGRNDVHAELKKNTSCIFN